MKKAILDFQLLQRALDSQRYWVKNVSSFLLLRFKLWAFVKLWGTLLTSETEIVELSWAESFMCCDVDTWLNDKDAQRVVGFYCTGCVNSPCRRKRFDRGWRDMQMSRLPLGNLSWPDLSPRPSLPTGDTFPVKRDEVTMQMSGLPSSNPSCCTDQLTCPPVQRLSTRPSLPPLVINSRTGFVSADEMISVALTRKTTINMRVHILFEFGMASAPIVGPTILHSWLFTACQKRIIDSSE